VSRADIMCRNKTETEVMLQYWQMCYYCYHWQRSICYWLTDIVFYVYYSERGKIICV